MLSIVAYVLDLARPKLSLLLLISWHEFFTYFGQLEVTIKILAMDYYEQRYQERVINNLQKKALALGFELIPQPEANTVS
ncbi:hypothetical protein [Nostoc sp.]|uniref:hypothetical protein n=1 Tax=Nostoc sp. TaxID=1180 RepID=UPI002FF51811